MCMLGYDIVAWTWPNDYNITQHPQKLHGKFDHFQIWASNTQHVATHWNRIAKLTQDVAPISVVIYCVEMLRFFGWGLSQISFIEYYTSRWYASENAYWIYVVLVKFSQQWPSNQMCFIWILLFIFTAFVCQIQKLTSLIK